MSVNKDFLAPCGLYCGVCGVYFATRDDNAAFLDKLGAFYQGAMGLDNPLPREELQCKGCMSDKVSLFCRVCAIKECTAKKGYEGCHECADWPCEHVENFPVPVGKKVIMRAVPYWREHGTEKYISDEEARYVCPQCGNKTFRGAKRCNKCKTPLDLD